MQTQWKQNCGNVNRGNHIYGESLELGTCGKGLSLSAVSGIF